MWGPKTCLALSPLGFICLPISNPLVKQMKQRVLRLDYEPLFRRRQKSSLKSPLLGELQPQTKLLRHFHGFSNLHHESPLNGAKSLPSLPPVKCCLGLTPCMRVYFWCYYKQHWKKGRENGLSLLAMVSNFVRTSAKNRCFPLIVMWLTGFCPMF